MHWLCLSLNLISKFILQFDQRKMKFDLQSQSYVMIKSNFEDKNQRNGQGHKNVTIKIKLK